MLTVVSRRLDYATYFGRMREIEQLVIPADRIKWVQKYQRPTRQVETLLYLGCNVLMTAHLAQEVIDVFELLGVDFEAVGGVEFCCGIVHHREGDIGAASHMSRATVKKFESYGAKQVVMWCPSCNLHFDEVILRKLRPTFAMTHTTAFLADRIDRLRFEKAVPIRLVLHAHTGRAQQEADAAAARKLLEAVPGVELAGVVSDAELSYHCSPQIISRIGGRDRFIGLRRRLIDRARGLGADTIATLYHSCHREWCEAEEPGLQVRSYISILSEALGGGQPDNYKAFKKAKDPEAVVAASRAAWASHGLSEDQARELVRRHFPGPDAPA
jgi:heterodisulfide reductase subunit D